MVERVAARERRLRAEEPGETRLVTRLVPLADRAAYEWRALDPSGRVVRKGATLLVVDERTGALEEREYGQT